MENISSGTTPLGPRTSSADADTVNYDARSLDVEPLRMLLRTSFGIGIVGGSEWGQVPQGAPAILVDLAGAALEQ